MAIQSRKRCSICGNRKIGVWILTTDCTNCRKQWKAFYAGQTPISPLMRAITAEQIERVAQSHGAKPKTRQR